KRLTEVEDCQKRTIFNERDKNAHLHNDLETLRAENKRLREEHRWIPVTERLPDENIYVLALAKARSIQEPGYNMQVIHNSAIAFGLFSHWQPLPQPPKEQ